MKKFLLLAGFALAFFAAPMESQAQYRKTLVSSTGNDTLENSGTSYLTASLGDFISAKDFSFVVEVTKISGTPAATVELQGSDNNTRWGLLHVENKTMTDTFINGDKVIVFSVPAVLPYMRWKITRTGTNKQAVKGSVYIKK